MTSQPLLDFDGDTYEPARDRVRLTGQSKRVFICMRNTGWWSLAQLSYHCMFPEASISARIRDFRKDKFGGHTVERRRTDNGLFEYRLIVNEGG